MVKRTNLLLLPLAALLGAWWVLLGPSLLGGPTTYVMVSGQSMEPTLHVGDLAVVRKHDSYGRGDIVAFYVPEGEPGAGAIVIHRIVGGSAEEGFVMQGDNKTAPDPWHPTGRDVVGKMWVRVPGAGRVLGRLRAPLPLATLAGGLAFLFALYGRPSGASAPPRPSRSGPRPAVPSGPGLGGRSTGLGDTWAFGPRRSQRWRS